jgi:hypothetical protein
LPTKNNAVVSAAPAGLWFDAPDGVERLLQLAKYSAGAEERDRDTDHGGQGTGRRLAGTRSDVLHRLGAAAIEERIELVKDLSAGDFAVAVDEPKNSLEHEHIGARENTV